MLEVPHLRQQRSWSCGPACVRMILAYYGEEVSEQELIEEMGADSTHGTHPTAIARFLRSQFRLRPCVSVDAIQTVGMGRSSPVIVAYQDHGPRGTDYAASWDHGHYGIIVAADKRRVTLVDPSSKRPRRHLKTADFLARWHDIDASGKIYRNWGLAVGPRK